MKISQDALYFAYAFIGVLIIILSSSMWNSASQYSEDQSTIMSSYDSATAWISNNLDQNKTALLPSRTVFLSYDPSLNDRTENYANIWNSSGVILRANTTNTEILKVRHNLQDYIHNNKKIEYLVFDWVDPYALKLFETADKNCKEFDATLIEIKKFSFVTPHSQWHNKITICKINIGIRPIINSVINETNSTGIKQSKEMVRKL